MSLLCCWRLSFFSSTRLFSAVVRWLISLTSLLVLGRGDEGAVAPQPPVLLHSSQGAHGDPKELVPRGVCHRSLEETKQLPNNTHLSLLAQCYYYDIQISVTVIETQPPGWAGASRRAAERIRGTFHPPAALAVPRGLGTAGGSGLGEGTVAWVRGQWPGQGTPRVRMRSSARSCSWEGLRSSAGRGAMPGSSETIKWADERQEFKGRSPCS